MVANGTDTAVLDRFEGDEAVLVLESSAETAEQLVVDSERLPADGRQQDALFTVVVRDKGQDKDLLLVYPYIVVCRAPAAAVLSVSSYPLRQRWMLSWLKKCIQMWCETSSEMKKDSKFFSKLRLPSANNPAMSR